MGVNKEHKEFHILDVNSGWDTPRGYPKGIQQKILSGTLDEANRRGTRTRLLRFAPGVFTTAPFVHEYWEGGFLVSGDLVVGNDANGNGGKSFPPIRLSAARRLSWPIQVEQRLRAVRDPLLRPGLTDKYRQGKRNVRL